MILRKEENVYSVNRKRWKKQSQFNNDRVSLVILRKTIYFLFIPVFWSEKIIDKYYN